ncbi:MAG: thiamine-binding protein [Oscillospiraceae bacterium]|nr:thiamine-binding protein [Oscillospiraceae bacterium]
MGDGGLTGREECSVAIQVLPSMEEGPMLAAIDKVIAHIRSTGMRSFVGPFETTVEGGFEECMGLIGECLRICAREGAGHVMSYVKIAYGPSGGVMGIDEKVGKHQG